MVILLYSSILRCIKESFNYMDQSQSICQKVLFRPTKEFAVGFDFQELI